LDAQLQQAPVGIPGELHIAGIQVARGYHGRPELTAERFVPDAHSGEVGARLYRTGDRVRWLASGELEFLGRVDEQVKLRGLRIEPGEIEAALLEHPGVRAAAVVVREDAPGRRMLVGYVVAANGALSLADVRDRARRRLPEYMVPGAVVELEALPLTPAGKLDRRALPAPSGAGEEAYAAPRTPTEEILAGIFAEVLGAERVGAHDDFFELGGHSLLATRVVSRVREALGVEPPLRALFEAPTVARLAERVDALRTEGGPAGAPPLVPLPRDAAPPLSFAQQRLWLIDRLEPGSAAYNMPFPLRLRGELDVAALRRALSAVAARHESLRTVFAEGESGPVQVIHAPAPARLEVADLGGLPREAREAEALRLVAEESLRPFDLARGPLLRSALLRLGEEEWALLFTLHHVVGDAWSTGVLVREVSELYAAFTGGREPVLPALPVQYADYAAWQRAWLSGETLERQLGWWRERLAGAPPLLEIPTDRPRAPVAGAPAADEPLVLDPEATRELRALARREGATPFMALLAAWQLLLGRYSGQEDVVVGSPVAGRTRTELEPMVGFFVNTLVLRTDLSGDPSFLELLGRVRETTLGAFQHQEIPFERLVEELQPERSLAHSPLFQVMFALQTVEEAVLRLGRLRTEPIPDAGGVAQHDLNFSLHQGTDRLWGTLRYRTDLFEASTAARMLGHFRLLLEGALRDPRRPLSDLPLLTAEERTQVLDRWNAAGRGHPPIALHERFERQARLTPEAVALVHGGTSLTYRELDEGANRLAHHLRRRGVGPDARVALCAARSVEMLVGVLGTLKAGGACVPLDPAYPAGRLAFMLAESGARVLLTQARLEPLLPESGAAVVRLDADADEIARESAAPPAVEVAPENLAYVVFTSGSTGRPKGVAMPHGPLAGLLDWQESDWREPRAAATLQFTTIGFDVAFQEIFSCWSSGGRLVLVDEETRQDPAAVLRVLEEEGVERLFLPYVALQQLAEEAVARGSAPAALRDVVTAGEQLRSTESIRAWFGAMGIPLHNQYGPSETHVVTSRTLAGNPAAWPLLPDIGVPVASARCYVLDARLRPVPPGVPGELYLGGGCLARGYLDRPDATAERFVPDPHAAEPGARMYRSGDRARWRGEGALEFLGRVDHQVKVRGFRVEPGEVEAALLGHERVREAAVVAREDAPGGKRLVAYVAPRDGAELPAAELKGWLRERLPEHMVPGAYVVLERLPLTPTGKTDRRALPAPSVASGEEHAPPRTPTEEILCGIWGGVLHREVVGVEDDFFELGGHSLLATQVVSRIRAALGVEVPLRALFEAPTPAGLAARVEPLLRDRPAVQAPPLARVPRGRDFPLSFAQQRLWFIDQLEPGSPAYNLPAALRLRGRLDVPALRGSLEALVRRHESLRTVFAVRDGEPVQVIRPAGPVSLPVVELARLPGAARETEAVRLAEEEALRPFDLARGPLLRATLLRLGEDDHAALFTLHHVVSDGWSMDVLVHEVSALYAGEPLPELPVQYADFAVWQREWLSGETLEAQLGYWRERLAGAPPVLELPVDRPRPATPDARAGSVALALPAEGWRELRELARREGATPFMALLAVWQLLLARWSGQEDVGVGSPIAGRTRTELEPLIGFFVNTLVLRTDLSGDPSFLELLGRVRETTLGAFAHQDLPFERLVEELHPERSLAHTPLFQAMLALQNTARGELRMGDLELAPLRAGGGETARFDLALTAEEADGELRGAITYRAGLWDRSTVERMAAHLATLLESLAARPGRPVGEAGLLTPAERARLLDAGYPRRDFRRESVHALFAEQAARTPDAVAVAAAGGTLTYAGLDRRADRLARHLRGRGVGPEVGVGIFMERSTELVVALLAVLRAGGAYVPLDPSYPAERLAFTLADSGARVVLAQAGLEERLPELGGVEVVRVDEAPAEAPPFPPDVFPDGLAYVIYTSGSTGTPKGVAMTHGALTSHLQWLQRAYPLSADDRVLQKTPLGFDASVWELWAPLLAGATLVMAPPDAHRDPAALARVVESERITVFQGVPSLLAAMAEDGELERCAGLRLLFSGGEALPAELAERARAATGAEVVNLYGPTEACIQSVTHRYAGGGTGATVPIGRPVDNVRAVVLDRRGEPVPTGVPGELHLGGAQLARGYLGRPELTAERFVPDPFGEEPGARLYRTGDRVRWLAEGALEFLGRVDEQVKVRGFRIEPGEVEAALERHPAVRDAVVVAREDAPGDRRLVAYFAAGGEPPAAGELRRHLRAHLPEHMVPSVFVALDALPLTPSGKLDRRALPAPEAGSAQGRVALRSVTERALADTWAEVLRVERVGVHDNFFDLGGHSLLATRLVSRVREAFGVELPVRALFEAPTVARLAERVAALRTGGGTEGAPPLRPVPRDRGLPLSFAQQRLWFIDQMDPGSPAYNLPTALRLRGRLHLPALRASLDALVRRHEALRTRFPTVDGSAVQHVDAPAPVPLPILDLGRLPETEREGELLRLTEREAGLPFDLARGPLLRATLLRVAEDDHAVLFTLHHVVSDGWSTGVLVREVSALYEAYSRGEEPRLPELPVQYADYAAWQRAWLSGDVLDAQLRFWRDRLDGAPPVLELPADFPRRPAASAPAGHLPVQLSADTSRALRELSRREEATPFMALLAAFALLLSRYAGQEDVVVGSPIAGRTRAELEGLIGFFVNTLVLRTDLSGNPGFRELLGRVRETTLGAYQNQDLPFERLVEELHPERSLTHTPFFQVMFSLQNTEEAVLRLGELRMEPFSAGEGVSQFDLDLSLREGPDRIEGELRYRADLFEPATAGRMAEHFRLLLDAVLHAPERPLSEVSLLAPGERAQLLEAWNATARDYPRERSLHELVSAQAARTPDAPAVLFGGRALSYAELDDRAERLARRLRALGVRPEARVAICVERGPAMAVAILAVLRAGGAYVPLDPAYPAERLAWMLEDSGARLVLTQAGLEERVAREGVEAVRVDEPPAEAPPFLSDASPDHLAYVIYTSGSTGTPKGVAVPHRAVVNLATDMARRLGLGPDDRVLQFASPGFDVVVEEIFPAWLAGAAVVFSREELFSPETLLRVVEEEGVTTFELPTAYWHEWVRELTEQDRSVPASVRRVLVGGERVAAERLREWARLCVPLVHVFGLTETACTSATLHLEAGEDGSRWSSLPVGRPTGNVRLYVLDRAGQPVPAGVPGELLIGGEGVARGYLGRPALTAERFVPDAFSAEAGARAYRTGDRVRWLAEGTLEFLGRIDQQVKVRGFRIEPGEVEAALERHAAVREVVVLVRENAPGDRRLVAYYTAGGGTPAPGELREHLKGHLPEHMVPSAFVALEAFPLTPSGKLDRRNLPAPERDPGAERVEPRGEAERTLAGIWAEVLRTERVGVHDDFFDLGGHSLLATRVVSRVRRAFGVEVPLRALFEHPTVAGLAEHVEGLLRTR
ncbi:MAG TPA: amino acid adenylation domain-containing protein, partial [Longimicrobiaceae bacterium]